MAELREKLPIAVVLALALLGHDLFNAFDEIPGLFLSVSFGKIFPMIDLFFTLLAVPFLIWGIWNRSYWSRWAFVGYIAITIVVVSSAVIGEMVDLLVEDRAHLLAGYLFSIFPSVGIAIYFGTSKSVKLYLHNVKLKPKTI